jgi:hypothetical protein
MQIEMPRLIGSHAPTRRPCDVSIIIAHRGAEMGLWFTIESCIMDLERSGLSYEFRICANGQEELTDDLKRIKHYTEKTGHMGEFIHVAQAMSPPSARQMAAEDANGKYLFFFDNHCMPTPGYFATGVASMESWGIDFLHSATRFFQGEGTDLEYNLNLKRNFWTNEPYRKLPEGNDGRPYRIACAGHGGFAVRTSVWKECGGYFQGFEGYGGEETSTDLKFWLLGKEIWIDPQMIHLHWAGKRSYERHFTDDYYRNMFMAANLIGGDEWLHTVFNNAVKSVRCVKKDQPVSNLYDLMVHAQQRSKHCAKAIAERRTKTLNELLAWFDDTKIRR